jgi:hypothetical protein
MKRLLLSEHYPAHPSTNVLKSKDGKIRRAADAEPTFGCWHCEEVGLLPVLQRTILPLSSGLK